MNTGEESHDEIKGKDDKNQRGKGMKIYPLKVTEK